MPREGGGGGAETTVDAVDGGGTMAGMSDHQPYDPKDPYWLFKEVAAFEREFFTRWKQG